jgi:uncharacterized protein
MKMNATVFIPAPPERVWQALNDPETLKAALPGCQTFERVGEMEFRAAASVAIGPVRSSYRGALTLFDVDPPRSYRVTGSAHGGSDGSAAGSAHIRLIPNGQGTEVHYEVEAVVGGHLALISQRFVDQAAKKMAEDFFARFSGILAKRGAQ